MFETAVSRLEETIGHRFARRELIRQALTHASYAKENDKESYERLEFLGDRVVELVVSDWLFENRTWTEGDLSKALSWLVDEESFAGAARGLGLGEVIRLGKSYAGRSPSASVLADSYEALIGALYLDSGMGLASKAVVRSLLKGGDIGDPPADYFSRSVLEERCQKTGRSAPVFSHSESGREHEKVFECIVSLKGGSVGRGSGRTKKEAERRASADLLSKMK